MILAVNEQVSTWLYMHTHMGTARLTVRHPPSLHMPVYYMTFDPPEQSTDFGAGQRSNNSTSSHRAAGNMAGELHTFFCTHMHLYLRW